MALALLTFLRGFGFSVLPKTNGGISGKSTGGVFGAGSNGRVGDGGEGGAGEERGGNEGADLDVTSTVVVVRV